MQLSKIACSAFGLSLASNFALADFTNFPSSNCAAYSGTSTLCVDSSNINKYSSVMSDQLHRKLTINQALLSSKCAGGCTGVLVTNITLDILVWRKVYKSNLLNDPIAGFAKLSDTYIHHKLINGEYKKQPTEQSVIKGWLAANNLTWQKGYPSKSECPGQEGKLIPEIHDLLLNDPDVLK